MILQFVLVLFLLFALSRVYLRFKSSQIKPLEFIFWLVIFSGSVFMVVSPQTATKFANFLGVGRGVDLIIYASIAALFYLLFRVYVMMEDLRHEITEVVRALALQSVKAKRRKAIQK